MGRNSSLVFIFILVFVSHACNASFVLHVRKLIAGAPDNASTTSQIAPSGSPVNKSNTTAMKSQEHKQKESQMDNQTNSNRTLPIDSKGSNKNGSDNKNSSGPSPSSSKKNDNDMVDRGHWKPANATMPRLGDSGTGSCNGSLTSCRDQEMLACIEAVKGSKQVFLVVQNEGGNSLKANVNLPNYLTNDLAAFEVPNHETRRMDISSLIGKSTELIVDSGNAKCTLQLVRSVSADNFIQQLSFYSKQVTPIYAAYASFLLILIFGGILACCKLRKRYQQNGIPYQELEMGFPKSASAVNADAATEGWDHDWDDDDWEEDSAVKSPAGPQIRSVSVDGLTSRSSKKDGWDADWDD
ncbi:hypothetical protein OROGR_017409 [Orobanche gracilis]